MTSKKSFWFCVEKTGRQFKVAPHGWGSEYYLISWRQAYVVTLLGFTFHWLGDWKNLMERYSCGTANAVLRNDFDQAVAFARSLKVDAAWDSHWRAYYRGQATRTTVL